MESDRCQSLGHPQLWRYRAEHFRRISRHNGIVGYVASHDAAGTHHGVFADHNIRENRCTRTDGGALFHQRRLHSPVLLRLKFAFRSGRTRKEVIDKDDAMAHEDVVFDGHTFTNEAVARDFAVSADFGVLLDLDKRAYLCVVADFTAIQIDKGREPYVFPQSDIGSNGLMVVHSRMICPLFSNERSAASRSLTTPRPATPSFSGVRSFAMQSRKYSSSTFRASVCSTLGAHTSPER